MLKKLMLIVSFCFINTFLFAQQMNTVAEEPTDFMRGNGKIYVVVAVVTVIVIGLFIYLINLDRKISKMEKGGQ